MKFIKVFIVRDDFTYWVRKNKSLSAYESYAHFFLPSEFEEIQKSFFAQCQTKEVGYPLTDEQCQVCQAPVWMKKTSGWDPPFPACSNPGCDEYSWA